MAGENKEGKLEDRKGIWSRRDFLAHLGWVGFKNGLDIRQAFRVGVVILIVGLFFLGFLHALTGSSSNMPFEKWYGNWPTVVISTTVILISFFFLTRPRRPREWQGAGLATAFFISLFTEMFGIPLTIYLLAPLLGVEPRMFGANESHLWAYLLFRAGGMKLEAGVYLLMAISSGLIAVGFYLLAMGWKEVYEAQGALVTEGLYARLRHPQYLGLIFVVVSFLVMWPTLLTVLLAPVLIGRYILLAKEEDKELEERFGEDLRRYREKVSGFIPSID